MTDDDNINEVRLRGRLAAEPTLRELPSGDTFCVFRVVVDRPAPSRSVPRGTTRVDSIECAAWEPRLAKEIAEEWDAGSLVEITGRLCRRFFRAGGQTLSRVEVEVATATFVRGPEKKEKS